MKYTERQEGAARGGLLEMLWKGILAEERVRVRIGTHVHLLLSTIKPIYLYQSINTPGQSFVVRESNINLIITEEPAWYYFERYLRGSRIKL